MGRGHDTFSHGLKKGKGDGAGIGGMRRAGSYMHAYMHGTPSHRQLPITDGMRLKTVVYSETFK